MYFTPQYVLDLFLHAKMLTGDHIFRFNMNVDIYILAPPMPFCSSCYSLASLLSPPFFFFGGGGGIFFLGGMGSLYVSVTLIKGGDAGWVENRDKMKRKRKRDKSSLPRIYLKTLGFRT